MITAAEARELSGPGAEDYVAAIEKYIRREAANKLHEVLIRDEPYAYWLYHEDKLSAEPKKALKMLRDAGFTVSLYYRESQFADIALHIQW